MGGVAHKMTDMQPVLTVDGLSYRHPGGEELLSRIGLRLLPGELVWLTGPSGGGKSTLLRLLGGLISPGSGRVLFQGKSIDRWPPTQYRRKVALLLQVPVLIPGSVSDNLLLPFQFKAARSEPKPDRKTLKTVLQRLGMDSVHLDLAAGELSVGQKQRVALARLLLMQPKVLLLDEPVAALESDSRALVEMEAGNFAHDGGAVIMASHVEPGIGICRPMWLSSGALGAGS